MDWLHGISNFNWRVFLFLTYTFGDSGLLRLINPWLVLGLRKRDISLFGSSFWSLLHFFTITGQRIDILSTYCRSLQGFVKLQMPHMSTKTIKAQDTSEELLPPSTDFCDKQSPQRYFFCQFDRLVVGWCATRIIVSVVVCRPLQTNSRSVVGRHTVGSVVEIAT